MTCASLTRLETSHEHNSLFRFPLFCELLEHDKHIPSPHEFKSIFRRRPEVTFDRKIRHLQTKNIGVS